MVDQPARFLFFDVSRFASLFARSDRLRQLSMRLSAEGALMSAHLHRVLDASDALIENFRVRYGLTHRTQYPRRQWPPCPECGSHDTVSAAVPVGDLLACLSCHHGWHLTGRP